MLTLPLFRPCCLTYKKEISRDNFYSTAAIYTTETHTVLKKLPVCDRFTAANCVAGRGVVRTPHDLCNVSSFMQFSLSNLSVFVFSLCTDFSLCYRSLIKVQAI